MGSITNFLEDEWLDHLCNAAFTPAASLFLALATADPTDAATGASMSEVANTNGYARTAIAFSAAASRKVIQNGAVTFPQASGTWGTITHWALVTSATHGAGNVYAHGGVYGVLCAGDREYADRARPRSGGGSERHRECRHYQLHGT